MTQFTTVYLLRKGNPNFWARAFLRSYQTHVPPGARCLCILLKNFTIDETPAVLAEFDDLDVQIFRVNDDGYDLTAYRKLAAHAPDKHYLFLNSHSRILHPTLIEAFGHALGQTGGRGIIDASGSWETVGSDHPFPNPHIRTTGFLIKGADYIRLSSGALDTKADCHELEAGNRCLSRQMADDAAPVLVVNSDGTVFSTSEWQNSRTFRLDDQEKLLIADNRSMKFHTGTPARRRHHARSSWGADADPQTVPVTNLLWRMIWQRWLYDGHRYKWLSRFISAGACNDA